MISNNISDSCSDDEGQNEVHDLPLFGTRNRMTKEDRLSEAIMDNPLELDEEIALSPEEKKEKRI